MSASTVLKSKKAIKRGIDESIVIPWLYTEDYLQSIDGLNGHSLASYIINVAGLETNILFLKELSKIIKGDCFAAVKAFQLLPDQQAKLHFVINQWKTRENKGEFFSGPWGALMREVCRGGKLGGLIMQANLSTELIIKMISAANPETLMTPYEYDEFIKLPSKVEVYRVISEDSFYEWDGICWFLNPKNALLYAGLSNLRNPKMLHGIVPKEDILASFCYWSEVLINPLTDSIKRIDSTVLTESSFG